MYQFTYKRSSIMIYYLPQRYVVNGPLIIYHSHHIWKVTKCIQCSDAQFPLIATHFDHLRTLVRNWFFTFMGVWLISKLICIFCKLYLQVFVCFAQQNENIIFWNVFTHDVFNNSIDMSFISYGIFLVQWCCWWSNILTLWHRDISIMVISTFERINISCSL